MPGDPGDAPVVGLLAVAPGAQGRGVASALMDAIAADLALKGHARSVLHVLLDNLAAVRLYASKGWRPMGDAFQHTLLKRPTQTFVRELDVAGGRTGPEPKVSPTRLR